MSRTTIARAVARKDLAVEIGRGQEGDVATLMRAARLAVEEPPRADLAGIFRVVIGRLQSG